MNGVVEWRLGLRLAHGILKPVVSDLSSWVVALLLNTLISSVSSFVSLVYQDHYDLELSV